MKVNLDISKSIEENANQYYEKAKKAKRKLRGVKKAYLITLKKIEELKNQKPTTEKQTHIKTIKSKSEWYEKFRWFISSEGFLVIGGRDATTNDILIRKQTEKDDLVFHTEIRGSPFFLIKSNGKKIGEKTINETFQACASFSRAWKINITTSEVYYVKPEQVKKELGLPKGTFMIHGKREYATPELKLAIGIYQDKVTCGPVNAIKANCPTHFIITQGDNKKSEIAKKIQKRFIQKINKKFELDDIIRVLPPGESKLSQ